MDHSGSLSVLVVCTGNTCRSPIAQALLQDRLRDAGATGVQVASAGTWAQEGSPASEGSAQAVRGRGLDLSMHRSRRLSVAMLEDADLVLAMEPEHRRTILELAPELVGRVAVLSDYLAQPGDAAIPVHDPFGGSMEAYEEVARRLEHHVNRILPALLTRVGLKP